MTVVVYVEGALEPLILSEPFQATLTNMSASMNNGMRFFVGNTDDHGPAAIQISKITHMYEIEND